MTYSEHELEFTFAKNEISLITCKAIGNKRFLKSGSTHLGEFIRFSKTLRGQNCRILPSLFVTTKYYTAELITQ